MTSNSTLIASSAVLALILSACDSGVTPTQQPLPASANVGRSAEGKKEQPSKAAAALRGGSGYEVVPVPNSGSLAVAVTFTGEPIPVPEEVPVNLDAPHCGQKVFTENLLVDRETKGLKNVIVRLEGITKGKAPPGAVTVANKSCSFDPHVSVAVKGTKLLLRNADPVLHTTHPYLAGSSFFTLPMPAGDAPPQARPIPRAGLMEITCDVHKWMRGYIYVHSSPYLEVTDRTGKLKIDGIPPGKYSYVAWHESLGEKVGEVEVAAEQTAELKLEFSPPK